MEDLFVIPADSGSTKPLFVHLLVGSTWTWIDTGVASTPDEFLFPWLEQMRLISPNQHVAVITHADVDHFGGLGRLRHRFPELRAGAGVADRRWIQDRRALMDERYGCHHADGLELEPWRVEELETRGGSVTSVDFGLENGDRVGSSGSWVVLELPGHSPGHIGLWQEAESRAVIGDALLGWGLRDGKGTLLSPPPYFDISAYQDTIDRVEALALGELHTSHFPVMRGSEIADFIDESRDSVRTIGSALWHVLEETKSSTLLDLSAAAAKTLDLWPPEAASGLADPISAHLADWMASGQVIAERSRQGLVYIAGDGRV